MKSVGRTFFLYVMNTEHIIQSVICILAIDGRIDEVEQQFLQQLRQRLDIPAEAVNNALEQAKQGKRMVRLPKETAEQQRVFEVLTHAALADGSVTPQERRILDTVGSKIGLSTYDIDRSIRSAREKSRKTTQTPSAPSPRKPAMKTCPKCGAEQESIRADCLRCGIVFSRFKAANASRKDCDSDRGRTDSMEQFQSSLAFSSAAGKTVATLISIGIAAIVLLKFPSLGGGYREFIFPGLILFACGTLVHFTLLSLFGVVVTGEVINRWKQIRQGPGDSGPSAGTIYVVGTPYNYYIEYLFETDSGKMRRGKARVSQAQYIRSVVGKSVRVRYLSIFPWLKRLEVW